MASRKEKEAEAQRTREQARLFLQQNPDSSTSFGKLGGAVVKRDNTFEHIRESKQSQPQAVVQKPQPAKSSSSSKPDKQCPPGWKVEGVYFVHLETGCSIRCGLPPKVMGGLKAFKSLPIGWKIIVNPNAHGESSSERMFYWHAESNKGQWTFPEADKSVVETSEVDLPQSEASIHAYETAGMPEGAKQSKDDTAKIEIALTMKLNAPPPIKKIKVSSMFDS